MNSRFIDWIWHVRGSLALAPGQSSDDAFDKLDPLFRHIGTSFERTSDTLTLRKKDQAAQDKMSVFDGGVLRIEKGSSGSVLRYHLTSRALLFCFLLPVLFLGIAQFTIFLGEHQKPAIEAVKKPVQKTPPPMNAIDKALGAPAPDKPKKEAANKPDDSKKPSPTPAYVFAAIFAVLYAVGRILEDRLVKSLFRKNLLSS